MKKKNIFIAILLLALLLISCGGGSGPVEEASEDAPPAPEVEAVASVSVAPEVTTETEATAPNFDPQPPEGQRMQFETSDGTALIGYYYPASVPNAPIVVLMHWAGGDQTDWQKNGVIDWLQNRGGGSGAQSLSQQSVVYPPMPESVSFAVFTFDFRGFGESSGKFDRSGGLLDAKSAYEFAKRLEDVDPTRMAGIGSSIGSDGVVDGCADGCLGAFSFSPGSYLTLSYADEVKRLDDEGKPVT